MTWGGPGGVLRSAAIGNSRFAMDERSARLAENETIFRAGNERIEAIVGGAAERAPYLCECGDARCFEPVRLTRAEYEAVRSHPARFFVVPGHEDLTAGEVVYQDFPGYTVVEKQGPEGELVERSDPRAS
jgi:hypothetical protein